MGIFNFCCALEKKNCLLKGADGQDYTECPIFAVDKNWERKFEMKYSGYGSAEKAGLKVYDLGHSEYFDCWGVTSEDKQAHFVCKECAKAIPSQVDTFEEVEALTVEEKKAKCVQELEKDLCVAVKERTNINNRIKNLKAKLKRLKKS